MDSSDEELDAASFIRNSRSNAGMKPQFRKKKAYHYGLIFTSIILVMVLVITYSYKKSHYTQLKILHNDLESRIHTLTEMVGKKEKDYKELKARSDELTKQRDQLEAEVENMKQKQPALTKELDDLNRRIDSLEDNKSKLSNIYDELESLNKQKEIKINQIKSNNEELRQTYHTLTTELQSYDYQI